MDFDLRNLIEKTTPARAFSSIPPLALSALP